MRSTSLSRQIKDLRILGYEGPARYDLGQALHCGLCGELLDVTDISIMSSASGARQGDHGTGVSTMCALSESKQQGLSNCVKNLAST